VLPACLVSGFYRAAVLSRGLLMRLLPALIFRVDLSVALPNLIVQLLSAPLFLIVQA
jgi:hypothetical protein